MVGAPKLRKLSWQKVKTLCAANPKTCGHNGRFCIYQFRYFFGHTISIKDYKPPCLKETTCQVWGLGNDGALDEDDISNLENKEKEKGKPREGDERMLKTLAKFIYHETFYSNFVGLSKFFAAGFSFTIMAILAYGASAVFAIVGICFWKFGAREDDELGVPFSPENPGYGATDD
eukprot:Platyproteum_vivax@DN5678_c0_g1_i3.p1